MIFLTDDAETIRAGAVFEPVYGSVLETMFAAYRGFPGYADFYMTDDGGVLCRYGDELTLTGHECVLDDPVAFARMIGAAKLVCLSSSVKGPPPSDVLLERRKLLVYPHPHCAPPQLQVDENPRLDDVFRIIREGSSPTLLKADPAAFITDIGRRRILGLAKVYTAANAATAGVYATGSSYALIGSVATLPGRRGMGLATATVRASVRHCLQAGRIPALIAENDGVVDFYLKLGFVPHGESLTFITG